MDTTSKERIKELKAQLKEEKKKANKGSGKIRFKGLCKMLLGLVLLAPAPAALATGITLAVQGEREYEQAHTAYVGTDYYKKVLQEKSNAIAELEKQHESDEISDSIYTAIKDYYEEKYEKEMLDKSEYGAILKKSDDKRGTGVALALGGTIGGILISTISACSIVTFSSNCDTQFDMIANGAKELASGYPEC